MKKNKIQEAKPNIDETQARTAHRCITRYLNKEPFHSDLLKYIPLDGNPYTLLSHLLRSKRPLLGKEITKTWAITEQGIWHVANKLNGYLKDFSNSYEPLKSKNLIIQVPVGKGSGKGGKRFGYFLAGYNTKEQKYLSASEIKPLLEQIVAKVDISLSAKEILDKLRKKLTEEAAGQLEKKLRSADVRDYQPLDLELGTIETKKNKHNILTEEGTDIHFKKRDCIWRSYDIEDLDNFKGTCILSSDVGTGKTTFLRHLQLKLLDESKRMPVYIHASKIEKWQDVDYTSLEKHLEEKLGSNLSGKIPGNFWSEAFKEDLVLLIDGLDQITGTGDAYREFLDDLLELADTNQVDMIVASRPSAVISAGENETIHFLRLKPFSINVQKAYFGTHYNRALEICKHDLKMLAIPMLAFMVRFLIENGQDKDIVNGKDLYEHFVQYIFTKYKHEKSTISKHKRLEIRQALRNISYQALADDDVKPQMVPLEFCRKQIYKLGLRIEVDDLSKHGITNFIVDEAKNSHEILFFTHQSFQEYLAAEYISQTDKYEEYQKVLSEKWNSKWKEVIKFLAGFKGQTIIEQILSEQDNPIHSKLFLAAELVPEAPFISSAWRNKIFQRMENLLKDSVFAEDARKFLLYADLPKALDRLVGELESKDKDAVEAAIDALAGFKDDKGINKDIVKKIAGKLEDENKYVVRTAIYALVGLRNHRDINKDIIEKIVNKLEDENELVVAVAVDGLKGLKNYRDIHKNILEKIASKLDNKNEVIVEAAINALAKLKDHKDISKDIVEKIADKLEDENESIIKAAIIGLVELKNHRDINEDIIEKIAGKLEDENKYIVQAAIYGLAKLKDHKDINEEIVEKISDKLEDRDEGVVQVAINGLLILKDYTDISKEIVEKIAGKLEDGNKEVVQRAIDGLAEFKDHKDMNQSVVEKIADKLEDENSSVVRTAIYGLARLKGLLNKDIVEKVISKLESKDGWIVKAAIDSLAALKDHWDMNEGIIKKIADNLEDKNELVVQSAINTLVELKSCKDINNDIVKKITGKLENENELIFRAAINALIKLKDHEDTNEGIIEKIAGKLESKHGWIIQAVIEALVKLKDHKDMDENIIEKIADKLESKEEYVVEAALDALAELKYKITNDVIKKILPISNSSIYNILKRLYWNGKLIS